MWFFFLRITQTLRYFSKCRRIRCHL